MTYKIKHVRQAILTDEQGKETPVSYLGRGTFCEAWKNGAGVYLIVRPVKGEIDYSKEIISQGYFQNEDNPHIPKCESLGDFGEGYIYRMPFYEKLTAKHKEAWKDYRELSKIRNDEWRALINKASYNNLNAFLQNEGINFIHSVANKVQKESLSEAIHDLADAACSYGSAWIVEFAPRNLGVSESGELILRDCLFSLEVINKIRSHAQKF